MHKTPRFVSQAGPKTSQKPTIDSSLHSHVILSAYTTTTQATISIVLTAHENPSLHTKKKKGRKI